jgi:hypothetical protein
LRKSSASSVSVFLQGGEARIWLQSIGESRRLTKKYVISTLLDLPGNICGGTRITSAPISNREMRQRHLVMNRRHQFGIGGCLFPANPALSAREQAVFWSSSVAAAVVLLVPGPADTADPSHRISLSDLSNAVIREASDGWHMLLRRQNVDHRVRLRQSPEIATLYAAQLPFDDLFELRTHAARLLWRALSGRPPGPDFRELPAQRRGRLIHSLRALDARQDGASYRTIAAALFGANRAPTRGWKTHDLRNRTIRLVQSGQALMRRGYLDLLHYPLRRS